jgi:hypothetical protein
MAMRDSTKHTRRKAHLKLTAGVGPWVASRFSERGGFMSASAVSFFGVRCVSAAPAAPPGSRCRGHRTCAAAHSHPHTYPHAGGEGHTPLKRGQPPSRGRPLALLPHSGTKRTVAVERRADEQGIGRALRALQRHPAAVGLRHATTHQYHVCRPPLVSCVAIRVLGTTSRAQYSAHTPMLHMHRWLW